MKKYYVIAVKVGEETTAETNLKAQGFLSYNPVLSITKVIRGVTVNQLMPLFQGYMFVEFDIDKCRWRSINGTKGVHHLLTATENTCTPLPEGFVEALRKQECNGVLQLHTVAATVREFITGEQLIVKDGIFLGMEGTALKICKHRRTVLMALLNHKNPVTLPLDMLTQKNIVEISCN